MTGLRQSIETMQQSTECSVSVRAARSRSDPLEKNCHPETQKRRVIFGAWMNQTAVVSPCAAV
jgi:hypothetical protein